jgi:hypothetical protein
MWFRIVIARADKATALGMGSSRKSAKKKKKL